MKLIFFGTSEFAAPILKCLKEKMDWDIELVISESAKPQGRKNEVIDSPVSRYAKSAGLNLVTPGSLADVNWADYKPDVAVVAAYGKILPKKVLSSPSLGTVNIHPSLLPQLRGPSPIQTVLAQGLKETGVSLMLIDEKIDHGPILSQEKIRIDEIDNYFSLEPKLAELGTKILIRDLPKYMAGKIKPQFQDDSQATFTKLIKKEDGRVNWSESADNIYNRWRAFVKWPGIYTFFKSKDGQSIRLKLIEITKCATSDVAHQAGEVFVSDRNLYIVCGEGAVKLIKVQPENSKILTAQEFLNGYSCTIRQILE